MPVGTCTYPASQTQLQDTTRSHPSRDAVDAAWTLPPRTDHGVQVKPNVCVNPHKPPPHEWSPVNRLLLHASRIPFSLLRQAGCVKETSNNPPSRGSTPPLEGNSLKNPCCASIQQVRVFLGSSLLVFGQTFAREHPEQPSGGWHGAVNRHEWVPGIKRLVRNPCGRSIDQEAITNDRMEKSYYGCWGTGTSWLECTNPPPSLRRWSTELFP